MPSAGTKLLIATGVVAGGPADVPPLVRSLVGAASDIAVITPLLGGRLDWLVSENVGSAWHEADARLAAVLGQVRKEAPTAVLHEQVEDESPLVAFADAIDRFHPDHVLVVLRSEDGATWRKQHVVDELQKRFHLPITVFEIDSDRGVNEETPAGAGVS